MNSQSFFSKSLWIEFSKKNSFKFLLFIFLSSCLSPIDFPVEIKGGILVVTGQLSTISDQNIVQLGRTADTEQLPFPIPGAFIQLFDDAGNIYQYEEDLQEEGNYYIKNIVGEVGRTYHIQISLPDGSAYKSLPEKLPGPAAMESVYYEIERKKITDGEGAVVDQDFFEIFAKNISIASEKKTYLKWGVEEAFLLSPTDFPDIMGRIPPPCFIVQNADPQRIVLFKGDDVSTTSINSILVGSRLIDWSFLERHYFTIYQSSITKEAYEYWRKVNIVANQVGTIFDTPPATISGNIVREGNSDEKVLGYFQAINQTYSRFFVLPSDLPFPLTVSTCDYDGTLAEFGIPDPSDYPARCIDCLILPNSSYTRPDWF